MFDFFRRRKEYKNKIDEIYSMIENINSMENKVNEIYSMIANVNSIEKKIDEIHPFIEKQNDCSEKNLIQRMDRLEESLHYHINFNDAKVLDVFIPTIESYIDNDFYKKQGIVEQTPEYKYYKSIHSILQAYKVKNAKLERVGRENDGGYVMAQPYSENKIAYSLGICDDVSWDLEMVKRGYEIYQYDHTINNLPEENDAFHWFKLGITGDGETDELKHLDTLMDMNGHLNETGMLLKVDIEGFEWGMLNQLSEETLDRFDQIVMELHDVVTSTKREEILLALAKLSKTHGMVNIHANNNNNKTFCGDIITSDVLEITMLNRKKYDLEETTLIVPTELDQPNDKNRRDLVLGKW